jgi:acid phosphatase
MRTLNSIPKSSSVLFLLLSLLSGPALLRAQEATTFFVFGDWGREGKEHQMEVANAMTKQADLDHPKFILSTGDNFYEDGVRSVTDSQWQTSFERIYSGPSLQIPWYVALGNHDYITNADVEVAYSKVNSRWVMPSRYYAKEVQIDATTTALFLIIDTTPFILAYQKKDEKYHVLSQSTTAQLQWMDSVLSHSKAKWKFAVGHHPLYASGKEDSDMPELIDQMLPIFKKHHVQAYFCGHVHNLEHLKERGVNFYISGGGSQGHPVTPRADVLFEQGTAGFLEVALSKKDLVAKFYDNDGKLLDTSEVLP